MFLDQTNLFLNSNILSKEQGIAMGFEMSAAGNYFLSFKNPFN